MLESTVRYTPAQDRRHDFNAVVSWRVSKYVLGARLGAASGMPYTDVNGMLPRRRWDAVTGVWGGSRRVWFEPDNAERNAARLPATRRLDLYLERTFKRRSATFTPYLSVVNASNQKNILYYQYNFQESPGTRTGISQIPFVPSTGVSVVF